MFRARLAAASVAMVSALLSGCTQPVEVSADTKLASAAKNLPFVYDTSIDQIAHMSCSNIPSNSVNKSAYFTYRVGAYTSAGILLKDSFFDALKNKKPEYQAEVLTQSPANTDTIVQVALRGYDNYQSIYTKTGTAVIDSDYANMFTALGTEEVADLLIAQPVGARVRHVRSGTAGGFRMEGSLYFTEREALVEDTRAYLRGYGSNNGRGLLTVTYTNGSAYSARSIVDLNDDDKDTTTNARSVYGRGYELTFRKPATINNSNEAGLRENVLATVTEKTLDPMNPIAAGTWTCDPGMQLRIVRAEDINKTGARCRKIPDPAVLSPELRVIRNSLRAEDWYVDLVNRCIIPKKSGPGCYGAVTDIKYNLGDACTTDPSTGFSNCTQFASICYRSVTN
jgi:hypothetical protein